MRKINLVMVLVCLLLIAVVSGCSSLSSEPNTEVKMDFANKSFQKMFSDTDAGGNTLRYPQNCYTLKEATCNRPQFLPKQLKAEHVEKRKDMNGVERDMWMIEIDASVPVDYSFEFYGSNAHFCRVESFKYKLFLYKNRDGEYKFENGVLEKFDVTEFNKV